MTWPAAFFFPDIVRIRPFAGAGGMGESFGEAFDAAAETKDEAQLIRAADGAEVVSSTQVTVPLDTNAPLGSMVALWPSTSAEREAKVLRVARNVNHAPLQSFLILYLE